MSVRAISSDSAAFTPFSSRTVPSLVSDQVPDETLSIDGTVGCTRIVGVPKKVIHTVYIKIAVNYAETMDDFLSQQHRVRKDQSPIHAARSPACSSTISSISSWVRCRNISMSGSLAWENGP